MQTSLRIKAGHRCSKRGQNYYETRGEESENGNVDEDGRHYNVNDRNCYAMVCLILFFGRAWGSVSESSLDHASQCLRRNHLYNLVDVDPPAKENTMKLSPQRCKINILL